MLAQWRAGVQVLALRFSGSTRRMFCRANLHFEQELVPRELDTTICRHTLLGLVGGCCHVVRCDAKAQLQCSVEPPAVTQVNDVRMT